MWFGDRHNCFSLLPSGLIVSGGAQGVMEAYNTEGFPVTNFVGHESDIWSIRFNKDRSFMITSAADQTIRIWDLSDAGKRANEYPHILSKSISKPWRFGSHSKNYLNKLK